MEMDVMVYDPYVLRDVIFTAGATPVVDWGAVLPEVDFVSVNCPQNDEKNGMIGPAEMETMKKTAFVVNTPRGGNVDQGHPCEHPKRNVIAGAASAPTRVGP